MTGLAQLLRVIRTDGGVPIARIKTWCDLTLFKGCRLHFDLGRGPAFVAERSLCRRFGFCRSMCLVDEEEKDEHPIQLFSIYSYRQHQLSFTTSHPLSLPSLPSPFS